MIKEDRGRRLQRVRRTLLLTALLAITPARAAIAQTAPPASPPKPEARPATRDPNKTAVPGASAGADATQRDATAPMFAAARDRVLPALVNIEVVTVSYFGGKERKDKAVGSGTIITPEGHVITNQHVTDNGITFRCTLTDKRIIPAKLVGEDPLTDLAVLKLNPPEGDAERYPVASFGDSDELRVGDYVLAMGSPFSLSRSVTLGIVSNTERVFPGSFSGDELEEMELGQGQRTGIFTTWIQHDAAINPGNSGGPLVNVRGEVIGVNELGGENMGFAIPSNLAHHVARALIAKGEVTRSTIGVSFKSIQRTGLSAGVLVNSVDEEGPAGRAGLVAGDVITHIDGEAVTVRFVEHIPPLLKRIAEVPVGTSLALHYTRGDKPGEMTVVTERLQKDRGDEAAFRGWGFTATAITEHLAREHRLTDTTGVLITSTRAGGAAATAEPPLNGDDVIRSIDGQPVASFGELMAAYRKIMDVEKPPEFVLVGFERRGQNQVTLIKPTPDEDPDLPREVRKAWIGVATQPVLARLAERLGLAPRTGFRITRVYPGTLAAESELRVGDIILALNGEALGPRGLQDAGLFARVVRLLDIDDSATLAVWRSGEEAEVRVRLEPTRLTPEEARRDRNQDFELTVREVTFFDRDAQRWPENTQGVIIEQVEDAGWAGEGGLAAGDLIQQIDGQPVTSLAGYRKILENIKRSQPKRVVFLVLRGPRTHFQFVEPEWQPVVRSAAAADPNRAAEEGDSGGTPGAPSTRPNGKE